MNCENCGRAVVGYFNSEDPKCTFCDSILKLNVSDKKLHNHIRNIIINELGADKDFIREIIEQRVDKYIDNLFNDSYSSFRKVIMERVEYEMNGGLKRYYAAGNNNLQQAIHDHIHKYIKEWIESKYNLNISVTEK